MEDSVVNTNVVEAPAFAPEVVEVAKQAQEQVVNALNTVQVPQTIVPEPVKTEVEKYIFGMNRNEAKGLGFITGAAVGGYAIGKGIEWLVKAVPPFFRKVTAGFKAENAGTGTQQTSSTATSAPEQTTVVAEPTPATGQK